MKIILKYQLPNGKIPIDEWINKLDNTKKSKVLVRLEKLKNGYYGDYKKLPHEINELKFHSGERIYFYESEDIIIILLNAGNKQRQSNDIKKAEQFLNDYLSSKN